MKLDVINYTKKLDIIIEVINLDNPDTFILQLVLAKSGNLKSISISKEFRNYEYFKYCIIDEETDELDLSHAEDRGIVSDKNNVLTINFNNLIVKVEKIMKMSMLLNVNSKVILNQKASKESYKAHADKLLVSLDKYSPGILNNFGGGRDNEDKD